MKVEKYDFYALDTITLRSEFAKLLNEYIDELEVNYNNFCYQRDHGLELNVSFAELMVSHRSIVEILTFLTRCKLLKRKAYDRILDFIFAVYYELEEFKIMYGGN